MNNNLSNDYTRTNKYDRIVINKQRIKTIPYPLFSQKQDQSVQTNKRKEMPEKFYVLSLNRVTNKNKININKESINLDSIKRQGQTRKKSITLLPLIKVEATVVNGPKCPCERQKLQGGWVDPTSKEQISKTKKRQLSSYLNFRKIYNLHYPKFMQNGRSITTNKQRNQSPLGGILDRYNKKRYPSLPNIAPFSSQSQISPQNTRQISRQFQFPPQFCKLQTIYAKQIYLPKHFKSNNIQISTRYHNIPTIPLKSNLQYFIENYSCFSSQINLKGIIQQTNFMVQYYQTGIYFGQMDNNIKTGKGVFITNLTCFEGLFKNNQKIRGCEMYSKGIYKGQYYNNMREGVGEFQYINGQYYVGDWKSDMRHGNGTWTNKNGESYNGQWVEDQIEGYGVYAKTYRQYKGNFLNWKKQGWGKQIFQNGDSYEGLFKNGVPEGQGSYLWANKTKYEGQFHLGFRNGKGYLSTVDGWTYDGEFVEQKAQGQCQIVSNGGDIYKGSIRGGKKNGRGQLIMQTGDRIQAFWQDDTIINVIRA